MTEIFSTLGIVEGYGDLPEEKRCEILSAHIPWNKPIPTEKLSPLTIDTLELFQLLHSATGNFGPDCLGAHVISLTQCPATCSTCFGYGAGHRRQPPRNRLTNCASRPLFEKIDDLKNASQTLDAILNHPLYREHVKRLGERQIIMVGYSDSTKDGGYFAAVLGFVRRSKRVAYRGR